jgi:hypothetical protein
VLQRPGVAIPSDERARDIVARLALSPVPELVDAPRLGAKSDAPNFAAPRSAALNSTAPSSGAANTNFAAPESDAPYLKSSTADAEPLSVETSAPGAADATSVPVKSLDVGSERPSKSGAGNLDAVESGAVNSGALDGGSDLDTLIYARAPRAYVVQRGQRAEDGLTFQEQRLHDFLWRKGREVAGVKHLRIAGGGSSDGARVLAAEAGVAYSTFQALTRTLRDKFAIEIAQPGGAFCKVYGVHALQTVLVRQRAAGYDCFVKQSGGGRLLVNARGERCPQRADLSVEELKQLISGAKLEAPELGASNSDASKLNVP